MRHFTRLNSYQFNFLIVIVILLLIVICFGLSQPSETRRRGQKRIKITSKIMIKNEIMIKSAGLRPEAVYRLQFVDTAHRTLTVGLSCVTSDIRYCERK